MSANGPVFCNPFIFLWKTNGVIGALHHSCELFCWNARQVRADRMVSVRTGVAELLTLPHLILAFLFIYKLNMSLRGCLDLKFPLLIEWAAFSSLAGCQSSSKLNEIRFAPGLIVCFKTCTLSVKSCRVNQIFYNVLTFQYVIYWAQYQHIFSGLWLCSLGTDQQVQIN